MGAVFCRGRTADSAILRRDRWTAWTTGAPLPRTPSATAAPSKATGRPGFRGPRTRTGCPAPEPLGLPPEAEAAPEPTAPIAAAEPAAEPAVEAPADWGAAAEPPPEGPAETTPAGAEEEFPVTLSEADEIHEETTAPI